MNRCYQIVKYNVYQCHTLLFNVDLLYLMLIFVRDISFVHIGMHEK